MRLSDINTNDLLAISYKDLVAFQALLNDAIEKRKEQDKADFLNKIANLASESGLSLNEVLGENASKKINIIRYRNPSNPKQMWTGRGRKPNWLLELLNSGRNLEEFRV